MEILKEILRIVTSKSDVPKVLPELDDNSPEELRDSLTGKYLKGLLTDTFTTDDDAAMQLYGSNQSDQRYRTLKSRTYERLLHSILFLQVKQPEHSEYLSYYYRCTRNMICAQSLMRFASRKAGFSVALKTLTISQKYQFTDICLPLSVLLRETSAFWQVKSKFELYDGLVIKYLSQLEAEYRSESILDRYSLEMAITSRTKAHLASLAESYQQEISELEAKHGTHLLKLNKIRMDITVAIQNDLPEDIIKVCDLAIEYLTKNPHFSQPARLGEFRLRKMMSLLKVRRFNEAYQVADDVVFGFREGGINWYTALHFATTSAMLSGHFDSADNFISMALGNRKYTLLDEHRKETWIIFNAYIHLAARLGLYQPSEVDIKRQFRLSTYLNSVPEESKSKKVANVLILISHVFYLVLDGSFDATESRLEYLKVYVSRYLKEKHFVRLRLFIRLLQSMPRHSFNAKMMRVANKDLYNQLEQAQGVGEGSESVEYIQYEILYNGLLDFLEKHEAGVVAD